MNTVICPRCSLPCHIFDRRGEFTCASCGELVVVRNTHHIHGYPANGEEDRVAALRREMRLEFARFDARLRRLEEEIAEHNASAGFLAGELGKLAGGAQ